MFASHNGWEFINSYSHWHITHNKRIKSFLHLKDAVNYVKLNNTEFYNMLVSKFGKRLEE